MYLLEKLSCPDSNCDKAKHLAENGNPNVLSLYRKAFLANNLPKKGYGSAGATVFSYSPSIIGSLQYSFFSSAEFVLGNSETST